MGIDEMRTIIEENGFSIVRESRINNSLGHQFKLHTNAIICAYDTGSVAFQGPLQAKKDAEEKLKPLFVKNQVGRDRSESIHRVFVVYGHDNMAKTQLENLLRKWHLEPLVLDQLASEGNTVIEKLENAVSKANFGIVLATPDDEGYEQGCPDRKKFRVRQNVILELGMLLSKLGRKKVAILLKNNVHMERPSDINGLMYIAFNENVEEARLELARELDNQGYKITVQDL